MFERYRLAFCAEQDAPGAGGTASAAGVGAGTVDVNELVNVVVGKRVKKEVERLMQSLPEMIQNAVKGVSGTGNQDKKSADTDSGPDDRERVTLKALQAQVTELNQQLKKRDEALEQERQRVIDSQMRSEVREGLASSLGADNPNLPLVMDSLYDARKRFVRDDSGQTLVRFNAGYGADDELLPLKDGLKKLVDGELKHMLPGATKGLPVVGRGRNGQPLPANGAGKSTNVLDTIFSNVVAQAAASASSDPTQK